MGVSAERKRRGRGEKGGKRIGREKKGGEGGGCDRVAAHPTRGEEGGGLRRGRSTPDGRRGKGGGGDGVAAHSTRGRKDMEGEKKGGWRGEKGVKKMGKRVFFVLSFCLLDILS